MDILPFNFIIISANKKTGIYILYGPKSGKQYKLQNSDFFPVEVGDVIYGECLLKPGDFIVPVGTPMVIVPNTYNVMESTISSALKLDSKVGKSKIAKIYNFFGRSVVVPTAKDATTVDRHELICKYIDSLAYEYQVNMKSVLDKLNFGPDDIKDLDLPRDKLTTLMLWVHKHRNIRRLWLLGLNNRDIKACHTSPIELYRLCTETNHGVLTFPAISIDKCKSILERQKKTVTMEDINCAIIVREIYNKVNRQAWVGIPKSMLAKNFPNLDSLTDRLFKEYNVVYEYGTYYLKRQALIEKEVACFMVDMINISKSGKTTVDIKDSKDSKIQYDLTDGVKLSDDQKQAVTYSLSTKLSIVTGGAGSGKTTTSKVVIHNWEQSKIEYRLCAFTGKAAARLSEVTGRKAVTIHRLLMELQHIGDEPVDPETKDRNDNKPIKAILMDEVSMLTIELFWRLIIKMKEIGYNDYTIFMIGDPNQLPPISWGKLLDELLKIPEVPVFKLVNNHRMYKVDGEIDGIIVAANQILGIKGPDPVASKIVDEFDGYDFDDTESGFVTVNNDMDFKDTDNFRILEGNIDFVTALLKIFKSQDIPSKDIVIITPYRADIINLNAQFKAIFNANSKSITDINGTNWAINDRVMAQKNDYNKDIYNGQEGYVTDINESNITIDFNGNVQTFDLPSPETNTAKWKKKKFLSGNSNSVNDDKSEQANNDTDSDGEVTLDCIKHSYAITVHKGQGSEWNHVIMYIPSDLDSKEQKSGQSKFLNKLLLYTAITRARRSLHIVSSRATVKAAAVQKNGYRCDNLAIRIRDMLGPISSNSTTVESLPTIPIFSFAMPKSK